MDSSDDSNKRDSPYSNRLIYCFLFLVFIFVLLFVVFLVMKAYNAAGSEERFLYQFYRHVNQHLTWWEMAVLFLLFFVLVLPAIYGLLLALAYIVTLRTRKREKQAGNINKRRKQHLL